MSNAGLYHRSRSKGSSMKQVGTVPHKYGEEYGPALPVDTEVEFEIMVPITAKGIIKGLTDHTIRMDYDEGDECANENSDYNDTNTIISSIRTRRALRETPGYIVEIKQMRMHNPIYPTVMINKEDILNIDKMPETDAGNRYLIEILQGKEQ